LRTTPLRLAAACAAAAALAGAAASAAASPGPALVKSANTTLGQVLVDARGHTLYLFASDRGGKSACYGGCAKAWPPYLTTGKPRAGAGATASMLGTTKRRDGRLQVTYAGHPLYGFASDSAAGETKGENVGGVWFAVSTLGARVLPTAAGGGGMSSYGGDPGYGD
jgi:predicted lipoprotein with Yx(FWY)xxD motif